MKLLYINVIEQNEGWGAEYFVNKGFLKCGVLTQCIDYRKNRYNLSGKFRGLSDFDALFLQRGDYFPLELLKSVNRPRFFWASELVSRCRDQDRLLKSGLFDHIFVHTNACLRTIVKNGWINSSNVSVLLNGFDADTQYKMDGIRKDIDILFVGNVTSRRQKILDGLKKDLNITVARCFGTEMTKMVNRAKIVLNIHADNYLDMETRIFECLACGAFIISETLSEENPFINGRHLVETGSIEEMKQNIRYFLEHEDERERIASEGHMEACKKHSYDHRAIEIANIMQAYLTDLQTEPINFDILDKYENKEKVLRIINPNKHKQLFYKRLKQIKDVFAR